MESKLKKRQSLLKKIKDQHRSLESKLSSQNDIEEGEEEDDGIPLSLSPTPLISSDQQVQGMKAKRRRKRSLLTRTQDQIARTFLAQGINFYFFFQLCFVLLLLFLLSYSFFFFLILLVQPQETQI